MLEKARANKRATQSVRKHNPIITCERYSSDFWKGTFLKRLTRIPRIEYSTDCTTDRASRASKYIYLKRRNEAREREKRGKISPAEGMTMFTKQRWMTPWTNRRRRTAPSCLKDGKSGATRRGSGKKRTTMTVSRDDDYH